MSTISTNHAPPPEAAERSPHGPPVILGCGTFGGVGGARRLFGHSLNPTAAWRTLDDAAALGLTVWETAKSMPTAKAKRPSALGSRAGRPAELAGRIRIPTKIAPASVEGMAGVAFDTDTDCVQRKLDASLERLGCRRVATYKGARTVRRDAGAADGRGLATIIESGHAESIGCCNVAPGPGAAAFLPCVTS